MKTSARQQTLSTNRSCVPVTGFHGKYEISLYGIEGRECYNLEAEITGSEKPDEIVIISAHYDSLEGTPGANDNATGVAALLALARAFADSKPERTLRFVAFVNEEPPFFQSDDMGSFIYARRCRERNENVVAMLSLETINVMKML
jgi:Iap family predicted aminopeptidase